MKFKNFFIISFYLHILLQKFKDLILTIPQREWYAQKKILWLVSKFSCTWIDLVEPSILNVVELLDYQDNLIQNQSFLVLEELITAYPDICDSAFFLVLKQEDFDNIELIEDLIKISILEGGNRQIHAIIYENYSKRLSNYKKYL